MHYVSRWRQILEAYNRVRSRLFNSLELLEGTDLALIVVGTPLHALMKKGPSVKYNVSRIQVAKRIVIPPKHVGNVVVECTIPSCLCDFTGNDG